MPVVSVRKVTVSYEGDLVADFSFAAAVNMDSPGVIQLMDLAIGDNTITVPTGGSTPRAATIIPPTGNAEVITLKGVGGDTGIVIASIDPTSIAFNDPPPVDFVLTVTVAITGLRIVWS